TRRRSKLPRPNLKSQFSNLKLFERYVGPRHEAIHLIMEALHALGQTVELGPEREDDLPALVVPELEYLVVDRLAHVRIDRGGALVDKLLVIVVERLGLDVAPVVRGSYERTGGDLCRRIKLAVPGPPDRDVVVALVPVVDEELLRQVGDLEIDPDLLQVLRPHLRDRLGAGQPSLHRHQPNVDRR